MSKEYFWGDALTSTKKEIQWNPSMDDDEDEFGDPEEDAILHFLFLKQAVLGPTAKEGERNVIEITTEKFDGDEIKQPLFSLRVGLNESTNLDIGVQPPVTFTLISGSGPVYLSGQHMIEINADDEDDDLEGEEEEEEEEDLEVSAFPELKAAKSKKRPLSTSDSAIKKSKMAKLDKDIKKEEEGDGEEDADMAEMEDDDDEEDDEDFEGEEDDEEEDSDEDEDGDEEEDDDEDTPEKPVTKKKGKKGQINGTSTANVEGKGDNKVKAKGAKKLVKAKGKKKIFSIDEVKQKIQAGSNVPKKEGKFKNYLQSTFHISEAKKLQDLWGWYRASIPN